MSRTIAVFSLMFAALDATYINKRSAGTASVDLSQRHGEAFQLGAGFIYGFPDDGVEAQAAIPDYLISDIKFNAGRAGGAQISATGWAPGGYDGYVGRFNSTLSNYRSVRKYNGDFILLPHDLWNGNADDVNGNLFPGDNGDWTEMERFYDQLILDLKANDMLEGLIIDLWNEPDGSGFWPRSWDQFLEYWNRAFNIVRDGLPGTLISGPAMANAASLTLDTWTTWCANIAASNTVPDHYSWHQIGLWEREPDRVIADWNTLRNTYGLEAKTVDNNEYAWPSEQNPANSAWYLAQFERYDIRALRANWLGGSDLHNYLANLVWQTDGVYYPNGDWQLYKYYAGMVGERIVTTASSDHLFDVFGTVSGLNVKLIAGTRTILDTYDISISGLNSLGLDTSGTIDVRTYRFDWEGNDVENDGPVDLGVTSYIYESNTLSITLTPATDSTAYAFEFSG